MVGQDAREHRRAGRATPYCSEEPSRATRRHPLPRPALPRPNSGAVRRTHHHHPVRSPRHLRNPRLRPGRLHLHRHRRSPPQPSSHPPPPGTTPATSPKPASTTGTPSSAPPSTKPPPTFVSASATSKQPAAPAASSCAWRSTIASRPLPPAKNLALPNRASNARSCAPTKRTSDEPSIYRHQRTPTLHRVRQRRPEGKDHRDLPRRRRRRENQLRPPVRELGRPRGLHQRMGSPRRPRREALRPGEPIPHRLLHTRSPLSAKKSDAGHRTLADESRDLRRRTPPDSQPGGSDRKTKGCHPTR